MTAETPEDSYPEKTLEAVRPLIKLITLANAGGVAATITIIGATAKDGGFERILAWPLGLFAFGVCFSILYPLGIYLRIARREGFEPSPPKLLMADNFLRSTGYGAISLFIAGCLSGVWIIACN